MGKTNILVTGGSGLIGTRLKELYLSTSSFSDRYNLDFLSISTNLETKQKLADDIYSLNPDIVLHLAWISNSLANYDESLENLLHLEISKFIFEVTSNLNSRFIGIGSMAEDKINSQNLYSKSKRDLYNFIKHYSKMSWVRPSHIYDLELLRPRLVRDFMKLTTEGVEFKLTNPFVYSDYINSRDIATGIYNVIDYNHNDIINLSSGFLIKNEDFINFVRNRCSETSHEVKLDKAIHNNSEFSLSRLSSGNWIPKETFFDFGWNIA
jgi:nucleoside-diphosphate-sugar epimerase